MCQIHRQVYVDPTTRHKTFSWTYYMFCAFRLQVIHYGQFRFSKITSCILGVHSSPPLSARYIGGEDFRCNERTFCKSSNSVHFRAHWCAICAPNCRGDVNDSCKALSRLLPWISTALRKGKFKMSDSRWSLAWRFSPQNEQCASSTDPYLFHFSPSVPGFGVQRFVSSHPGRAVVLNER